MSSVRLQVSGWVGGVRRSLLGALGLLWGPAGRAEAGGGRGSRGGGRQGGGDSQRCQDCDIAATERGPERGVPAAAALGAAALAVLREKSCGPLLCKISEFNGPSHPNGGLSWFCPPGGLSIRMLLHGRDRLIGERNE